MSITIGQVEIRPGQRVIVDLPVASLSTHTPMTMPVQVVCGRRPGPTVFVIAAIHGDEIIGVEILRRVLRLKALNRMRGTLIAVPIVNVYGFVAQSRYMPDRRDLNRSFPGSQHGSLAARLAHTLMTEVVSKCQYGIDLHTAAIHRVNLPQIRANLDDAETRELAEAFGVPVIVNAGERDGTLRQAAVKGGVRVLVYEGGEALRFDDLSIRAGVRGVANILRKLDMLRADPKRLAHPPAIARSSTWVRAPISGILRTRVALGARVKQNQPLGALADPMGENEVVLVAHEEGIVIGLSNLPLVQEGDALFHIAGFRGTKAAALSLEAFEAQFDSGETAGAAP